MYLYTIQQTRPARTKKKKEKPPQKCTICENGKELEEEHRREESKGINPRSLGWRWRVLL